MSDRDESRTKSVGNDKIFPMDPKLVKLESSEKPTQFSGMDLKEGLLKRMQQNGLVPDLDSFWVSNGPK